MSKNYPVLDVEQWRTYQEQGLNADSLWLIKKNAVDPLHQNDLHGQFVAQIPREFILRFTRPGDVIGDPFMGRGTVGIEARRMGRHYMGVELNPTRAEEAEARIAQANDDDEIGATVVCDDCLQVEWPKDTLTLSIVHPPYLDIIKFNEDNPQCWSNKEARPFLANMAMLAGNLYEATEIDGHCVLVIGDVWDSKTSSLRPLGFECMEIFRNEGWQLRAIIVKNMSDNTKGTNSGKDTNLKYYRSLKSKSFRFCHEYCIVMRRVR